MSLESRKRKVQLISERFECNKLHPLIIEYKIDSSLFECLKVAAAIYISKCIPGKEIILNEDKLLQRLAETKTEIQNITPNGMIVAKRHLIFEYNALVKAFIDIIKSLNANDIIDTWHIPLNLRFKDSHASESNLKRHHPTEHIHSDSWAGESADSLTTMIGIFGDIERNNVKFYAPPDNFQEEWLRPLPSYIDGKKYADQFEKLSINQKMGYLYISDFSTLHASSLTPDADMRISIDTTFVTQSQFSGRVDSKETIHPWRENERMTHEDLLSIGEKTFFIFPDSVEHFVDSEGGFKHPSNLKVIECKELFTS